MPGAMNLWLVQSKSNKRLVGHYNHAPKKSSSDIWFEIGISPRSPSSAILSQFVWLTLQRLKPKRDSQKDPAIIIEFKVFDDEEEETLKDTVRALTSLCHGTAKD